MKPRAAWPILAKKAKEKCNEATVAVVKGRERITHLKQSIERMEMLHADYVARSLEAEKNLMTMSEAINSRGFLQQIRTLISRVEIDLNHAKQELEIKKNASFKPSMVTTIKKFMRPEDSGGLIYEGATEEYSYGIKLWNKHDYLMQ